MNSYDELATILTANPAIGVLCRNGRTVYYTTTPSYREARDPRELIARKPASRAGAASYRFRLARFAASRVTHVGCPIIAAGLELARITNKATRATFRKRDASPAVFAIGNGVPVHSFI